MLNERSKTQIENGAGYWSQADSAKIVRTKLDAADMEREVAFSKYRSRFSKEFVMRESFKKVAMVY